MRYTLHLFLGAVFIPTSDSVERHSTCTPATFNHLTAVVWKYRFFSPPSQLSTVPSLSSSDVLIKFYCCDTTRAQRNRSVRVLVHSTLRGRPLAAAQESKTPTSFLLHGGTAAAASIAIVPSPPAAAKESPRAQRPRRRETLRGIKNVPLWNWARHAELKWPSDLHRKNFHKMTRPENAPVKSGFWQPGTKSQTMQSFNRQNQTAARCSRYGKFFKAFMCR